MMTLTDFLDLIRSEKWNYHNTMDRLIVCRGVRFYFQNGMLKYIEDSRIRVNTV